ncbi:unnamed protein product [Didymodactylos carnosus]|uniref:Transposase Tc5 C-terminal domain-containing protein n=1 Tax=Didymodactylos carnosus TaxID=1234261 RepID=A0A8S2F933_9BILA|nr:unnamed protein product [Didymodactylos carnosus]CAF4189368.1 unnamed protein product [Didymodactylos carnosus]
MYPQAPWSSTSTLEYSAFRVNFDINICYFCAKGSLTINQPSSVTMQERQMAAIVIALLSKGPKFDYYEEITLDLGEMSDEEHSEEEEEERSETEAGTEEADPDWQDKEKAIDKYNLKNYSEDFMRQVVDFADETNRFGKMGEQVKKNLFEPKNVVITCSSSGKVTTSLVDYWRYHCFLPLVDTKCLLLSDSYPGQCHAETYEPKNCGGKQVTRLQIPQNTTDQLQLLDCYFNRQIKNFLKACYNRMALDELDIHLHQWNNIIRLVSLLHNQLSADVFVSMIKYSWFASGLLKEDPSRFQNVNEVCFPKSRNHEEWEEKDCDESVFINCARCSKKLCFEHFFVGYHFH